MLGGQERKKRAGDGRNNDPDGWSGGRRRGAERDKRQGRTLAGGRKEIRKGDSEAGDSSWRGTAVAAGRGSREGERVV